MRQAIKGAICVVAVGGLVILVGVSLLLFFLFQDKDKDLPAAVPLTATNDTAYNNTETIAPTSLEDYIQSLFPDYTLDAIHSEDAAETPQYLAYQWTLNDTAAFSGNNYSDWQIVQRFALATFYYATGGDDWFDNTNWLDHSVDECLWLLKKEYMADTVHHALDFNPCDDGIFQHFQQWQNGLQGYLPAELFLMTALQTMNLLGNDLLGGTLSTLIGHLTSLEVLGLFGNELSGSMPTELGTLSKLLSLNVLGNQLTGQIPTELGRLSRLEDLRLDSNVGIANWTHTVLCHYQMLI
jgi:Leucine-rich repeat (LRR) protein